MNIMIIIFIALTLSVLLLALIYRGPRYAYGDGAFKSISPADAKRRLDNGEDITLVDVRNPGEYAEKHIPGSILLPLGTLEKDAAEKLPDSAAAIFVYCLSGARSAKACARLAAMGYSEVYNMGGISGWPYETESGI